MDDLIKRLKALKAFLRGEEPLRGANFGEPNPALHKGMFWWRNYLGPMDEAAAALAEAQATIARLEAERAGLIADMARQAVHYVPAQGETIGEMREHVRATGLYRLGDCRLVWVNEGDLYGFAFRAALAQGKPEGA